MEAMPPTGDAPQSLPARRNAEEHSIERRYIRGIAKQALISGLARPEAGIGVPVPF
jgi:hypothetical protein